MSSKAAFRNGASGSEGPGDLPSALVTSPSDTVTVVTVTVPGYRAAGHRDSGSGSESLAVIEVLSVATVTPSDGRVTGSRHFKFTEPKHLMAGSESA